MYLVQSSSVGIEELHVVLNLVDHQSVLGRILDKANSAAHRIHTAGERKQNQNLSQRLLFIFWNFKHMVAQ